MTQETIVSPMAPTRAPEQAPAVGGGAVQLKQALTGKSFDVQQKMLAPRAPVQAKAVQREAVQRQEVRNTIKDGPYEWTSAYDVGFDEAKKECNIAVRVKLVPKDATVTEDDFKAIKANVGKHFPAIWDNKFKLTDKASGKVYALRLAVTFVENNEHLVATLNHGQGYANLSNWYAQPIGAVTPAHELGHQLGLKDEYVDVNVPDRKDGAAPGAHADNSIMGDYLSEGEDKAGAKLRHGQTIAGHVGGATGRTFDTAMQ